MKLNDNIDLISAVVQQNAIAENPIKIIQPCMPVRAEAIKKDLIKIRRRTMTPTWILLLKDIIGNVEDGYFVDTLEMFAPLSSKQERIVAVDAAITSVFSEDPDDWCDRLNSDYVLRKAASLLYAEQANSIAWHSLLKEKN